MADPELVRILREEGVEAWNAFAEKKRGEDLSWRADFDDADLSGADLKNLNLQRANLRGANLREACLDQATILDVSFASADLTGVSFSRAQITVANFNQANLSDSILDSTEIRNASFKRVDLAGTILRNSDFFRASLASASLIGADLTKAHFHGTVLCEVSFKGAVLSSTVLANVDLSQTLDLEAVVHLSPSTIDHRALSRSRGDVARSFLRGCGLADWEILAARLYNPDLSNDEYTDIAYRVALARSTAPIQINPIFLSYAHEDNLFVDELQKALDEKGVRSWRDKHDAEVGPLEKVIDRAIRMNPTVLLVLSEASVESDWVGWEIEKARALEKELKRPVLCPVAVDDAWLTGLRPDLRSAVKRYAVLDLSEKGAIEREMSRILKGLQIHYREGVGDG